MRNILQTVERIAASDLGVLIVGEEGTEQEWLARTIHRMSSRAHAEFVHIDCLSRNFETLEKEIFGAEELRLDGIDIFSSAFEQAAGGTIFLRSISELLPPLNAKLSRALTHQHYRRIGGQQEIPINVRVIASVARKPSDLYDDRPTGKEAYQRICPIIINLPPLRERREDIPILIGRFLSEAMEQLGEKPATMDAGATEACRSYDWPGNALELRRAVIHAAALCDGKVIRTEHLPAYVSQSAASRPIEPSREVIHA
jgi:DNA-binding NtrC family response regulator